MQVEIGQNGFVPVAECYIFKSNVPPCTRHFDRALLVDNIIRFIQQFEYPFSGPKGLLDGITDPG